jgi:hypothetical protein
MINEYAFARLSYYEQKRVLHQIKISPTAHQHGDYTRLQVAILHAIHDASAAQKGHATRPDLFITDMENLFGTEELCGVLLQLDEDPYSIITLAEYYRIPADKPATITRLANGGDGCCCTHYAYLVYQRLPGRVQIYGFKNEENPDCAVVKDGWHPGGHDFAVVDDLWIVDPWARHVHYQADMPFVHEIGTPNTVRIYGDQSFWTLNTEAIPFYDEHLKPIEPTSQQATIRRVTIICPRT